MRPSEKKTTTESIELYKQSLEGNNYSVQSIKAYLGDLTQFIKWLQTRRVDWDIPYRIERIDIVQFINHLAELEETFLASSLERSANRTLGVVENWKAHYPSPDSHPWKRMVLQAVGAGILGYLLSVADAELRRDSADFTARVEHVLHEELATMQQAMQGGCIRSPMPMRSWPVSPNCAKRWRRPWPGRRWRRKSTRRSSGSMV